MEKRESKGLTPGVFLFGILLLGLIVLFASGKLEQMMPLSPSEENALLLAESEASLADMHAMSGGIRSIGAQDRADRARERARCIRNREGNC